MIKVASAAPMNSQPVANGFPAPPPSVPAGDAASAMVYTNPAVNIILNYLRSTNPRSRLMEMRQSYL